MALFSILLTVIGLSAFEVISSIDNAIINAEVLGKMGPKARRWFMFWGLLFAVFVIRGLLPWLIIWLSVPSLGLIGAFTASFNGDPLVAQAIAQAAPVLLIGGGTFLLFLFLSWLFLEPKEYGLLGERFFYRHGVWFFGVASVLLAILVWFSLQSAAPVMAFGSVIGSASYFIVHGFRENAEKKEQELIEGQGMSDISKIFYLMIIDATFSMDGVLGAFAFTLAVPLILIGNGLGAVIVRQLTLTNIDRIKKYIYLENGAMYSIGCLGLIMILESFGAAFPSWLSPVITFGIVGLFFVKSNSYNKTNA